MSYSSPSDNLDAEEVCMYLNMTKDKGLADLIRFVWKQGYKWGYENGYEQGQDD